MEIGDKREDHWMTNALVVWNNKGLWKVGEVDELGVDNYWPWNWAV